jgi:ABC-type amino acid transport system permease subunit
MPSYINEFINQFKSTSVVGFVAVIDLTMAGDLIRARTFDAFVPLIIVAIIYLVVIWLCVTLIQAAMRVTDKRKKMVRRSV